MKEICARGQQHDLVGPQQHFTAQQKPSKRPLFSNCSIFRFILHSGWRLKNAGNFELLKISYITINTQYKVHCRTSVFTMLSCRYLFFFTFADVIVYIQYWRHPNTVLSVREALVYVRHYCVTHYFRLTNSDPQDLSPQIEWASGFLPDSGRIRLLKDFFFS